MSAHTNSSADMLPHNALQRIKLRSRIVGSLRLIVPAIGVIVMFYLLAPAIVEMFLPKGSFDTVRISDSRLIIDAPRSRGTMADGGNYVFTAKTAATELNDQDRVFLEEMLGTFYFANETVTRATSDTGEYLFSSEVLALTSVIDIISSNGDEGQIGSGRKSPWCGAGRCTPNRPGNNPRTVR